MFKRIAATVIFLAVAVGLAFGAKTVFTDGNPSLGIKGTRVTAAFLNAVNKHYCTGLDVDGDCSLAYAAATGTNDLTLTLNPALTQYVAGMPIYLKAAATNTGAMTLNVNGLGAKAIKKNGSEALVAEDVAAGQVIAVSYDGTNMQLISTPVNASRLWDGTAGRTASPTPAANTIPVSNANKALNDWIFPQWIYSAQVGTGLAMSGHNRSALAALNGTDVAFIDDITDSLRTYRFNGSTWALVGSGLGIASGLPALAALNGTDVAFIDDGNDSLRTYRFNGSTWDLVGSGLAIEPFDFPALAALNGTDVAYIDGTNDSLRTYRFNGSTWALVGSGLAIASNVRPSIAALNGTDVAFVDNAILFLRTYRFAFSLGKPFLMP